MQFLNIQLVKNRVALRSAAPWLSKEFRAAVVLMSEEFRSAEDRIFGPREAERLRLQGQALDTLAVRIGDVVQALTASGRLRTFRLHGAGMIGKIGLDGRPQGYRLYGLALSADPTQREFDSCIINASNPRANVRVIARAVGEEPGLDSLLPERTPTFATLLSADERKQWLDEPRRPDTEQSLTQTLDALMDHGLLWAELASTRPEYCGATDRHDVLPVQSAVQTVFKEGYRIKALLDQERRRTIIRAFLRVAPGQTLDLAQGGESTGLFKFEGLEQIGQAIALRGLRFTAEGRWASRPVLEFIDTPQRAQAILARSRHRHRVA